jgi:4-amino-4-deoxy-L-arabinose transferase-like glycosyltransferase
MRVLIKALAVAFAIRLLCLVLIGYRFDVGDAPFYGLVARNIADHHVFSQSVLPPIEPTLYRPPLYPTFVAAVWLVARDAVLPLQLLQCVLGTAAVGFMATAAASLSKNLGRVALWVLALSPFDAVYSGAMLTEVLVIFFLSAAMCVPLVMRSWWRWPLCGVLLGLTSLTRDVHMLLIPATAVVAALFLMRGHTARQRIFAASAILLCGALTIAPWTVRNIRVMHQTVPISRSSFARALWYGTWVKDTTHMAGDALGLPRKPPPSAFLLPDERELYERWDTSTDEVPRDRVFLGMFKRRVSADPLGVAVTWVRRAPRIWIGTSRFDIFSFRPRAMQPGKPLYYATKVGLIGLNVSGVVLGMAGIVIAIRKWRGQMFWFALPVVYTIAVLFPLDTLEPRYSQPVYACLLVMACFSLRYARVVWKRRLAPMLRRASQPLPTPK